MHYYKYMVKMFATDIQDKRSAQRETKAVLKQHDLGAAILVKHYEDEWLNRAMNHFIRKDYQAEGLLGSAYITTIMIPKNDKTRSSHLSLQYHTAFDASHQERLVLDRVSLLVDEGSLEGSRVQIDFSQGKMRIVSLLHSAKKESVPFASFQEHIVHHGLTDLYIYADKAFSRNTDYPYMWLSLGIDPHSPQIAFTNTKKLTSKPPHGGAGNVTHVFSYKAAGEKFISNKSSEKFPLEDYTDALQAILGMLPIHSSE